MSAIATVETDCRRLVDAMDRMDAKRREKGLTLTELAFISGVSTNSYCAYRRETRNPTLANLVALADTIGFEIIIREKVTP